MNNIKQLRIKEIHLNRDISSFQEGIATSDINICEIHLQPEFGREFYCVLINDHKEFTLCKTDDSVLQKEFMNNEERNAFLKTLKNDAIEMQLQCTSLFYRPNDEWKPLYFFLRKVINADRDTSSAYMKDAIGKQLGELDISLIRC